MEGSENTILICSETAGVSVLKAICEKENFTVVTCFAQGDICREVQQVTPQLLLFDLEEPMNGFLSMLQRIRKSPNCTNLPIIALSSDLPVAKKLALKERYAIDFIDKPFLRTNLIIQIKRRLGSNGSSIQSKPTSEFNPNFSINERLSHIRDERLSDRYISSDHLFESMTDYLKGIGTDSLTIAVQKSKLVYFPWNDFTAALASNIESAKANEENVTVMCFEILDVIGMFLIAGSMGLSEIIIKIFSCIQPFLRPGDVVSVDLHDRSIFILLPNTHLKMAKIIGSRIQQKFERQFPTQPFQIRLASFPQDGSNALEVMAMLDAGLEKMEADSYF